jgi:hypothetical protein
MKLGGVARSTFIIDVDKSTTNEQTNEQKKIGWAQIGVFYGTLHPRECWDSGRLYLLAPVEMGTLRTGLFNGLFAMECSSHPSGQRHATHNPNPFDPLNPMENLCWPWTTRPFIVERRWGHCM